MNSYIFEKASDTAIRAIWLESDEYGSKSVVDIFEMSFDGSKESLKRTVKCLYEMMFVGEQPSDANGYEIKVAYKDYDASLEGKARKQSSKEINAITEQLFAIECI
jgi:hypothetical protein